MTLYGYDGDSVRRQDNGGRWKEEEWIQVKCVKGKVVALLSHVGFP